MNSDKNLRLYWDTKERQTRSRYHHLSVKRGLSNCNKKNLHQEELSELLFKLNNVEIFTTSDFILLLDNLKEYNVDGQFQLDIVCLLKFLLKYLLGNDVILQLLSVKCIFILSLYNEQCCQVVAKMCAPFLTCFVSSFSYNLAVACIYTLGNLSASDLNTWQLLNTQNLLMILLKLLESPNERIVNATLISLTQFLEMGLHYLRISDLNNVLDKCTTLFNKCDSSHWIIFMLSCVTRCFSSSYTCDRVTTLIIDYIVQKRDCAIHVSIVSGTAFIRILANVIFCDYSGNSAFRLLDSSDFLFDEFSKLMIYPHFKDEVRWLLSNWLNHPRMISSSSSSSFVPINALFAKFIHTFY